VLKKDIDEEKTPESACMADGSRGLGSSKTAIENHGIYIYINVYVYVDANIYICIYIFTFAQIDVYVYI